MQHIDSRTCEDETNTNFLILRMRASIVIGTGAAAHASHGRGAALAKDDVLTSLRKMYDGAGGSY